MKTAVVLLSTLSLLLFPSCTSMKTKSPAPGALTPSQITWRVTQKGELRYFLYLPQDYDPKSSKTWPLMLFLHGAGERGTDLDRVAIHGPPMLVKSGKQFPFIIVSPQCPDGQRWENDDLLRLLDQVMANHQVDASRVYLTGLSMGGYGTWRLGTAYPERFAAIAPICGGGSLIDVYVANAAKGPALQSLPVWAFHGAKDSVVPLDESERMVRLYQHYGNTNVKLTVYPEADHNSWTETYNNPEFYNWLLKHRREPTPKATP